MGKLFYGDGGDPIDIPDRLLAHVKVVIATKLRRSESFTFSWRYDDGVGGRSTIWLQPAIPLRFVFDTAEAESLDSELLTSLANAASSTAGMSVTIDRAQQVAGAAA